MGIRDVLRGVRRTFTPLERRLLDAVGASLDGGARERYERQLDAVNKVQRLGEAREVNLYRMHRGRPYNDPAIAFADKRLEAELARVTFRVPGEEASRKVTFYLVQGFLFSLVFDPPAGPVLERDDVEVVDVKMMTDPMREREPAGPPPSADPERLSGELARWHERYRLSEVGQPLDGGKRRERLREIPARLPQDYLRLTEQTEGFIVGPCKVYGLGEVYGIALQDAEYQVLAELRDRGVLAVKNETPELWFIPFDGETRESVASFLAAIESRLQQAEASA